MVCMSQIDMMKTGFFFIMNKQILSCTCYSRIFTLDKYQIKPRSVYFGCAYFFIGIQASKYPIGKVAGGSHALNLHGAPEFGSYFS